MFGVTAFALSSLCLDRLLAHQAQIGLTVKVDGADSDP